MNSSWQGLGWADKGQEKEKRENKKLTLQAPAGKIQSATT